MLLSFKIVDRRYDESNLPHFSLAGTSCDIMKAFHNILYSHNKPLLMQYSRLRPYFTSDISGIPIQSRRSQQDYIWKNSTNALQKVPG